MRTLVMPLFFLGIFNQLFSQSLVKKNRFIINGKALGITNKFIYIWYDNSEDKKTKDSSKVINGSFKLEGNITQPTLATITEKSLPDWRNNGGDISSVLFIEPTVMTINIKSNDLKNAELSGSEMHDQYQRLEQSKDSIYRAMKPYDNKFDGLHNEYSKLVKVNATEEALEILSSKMDIIREELIPFNERLKEIDFHFFHDNPNSYLTAYLLRYYVADMTYLELKSYCDKMSASLKQSNFGINIMNELQTLSNGSEGSKAFVFQTTDIEGDSLSLSDYLGSYVLLDFWASWCKPCRAGNPHLKELYQKYKESGIEFIGISDNDGTVDKWKAAVEKDGTGIWRHILRGLKFKEGVPDFTNDISEKYGVHTLPTKILIDTRGVIIGRYGNESEDNAALDQKLFEIFN